MDGLRGCAPRARGFESFFPLNPVLQVCKPLDLVASQTYRSLWLIDVVFGQGASGVS